MSAVWMREYSSVSAWNKNNSGSNFRVPGLWAPAPVMLVSANVGRPTSGAWKFSSIPAALEVSSRFKTTRKNRLPTLRTFGHCAFNQLLAEKKDLNTGVP